MPTIPNHIPLMAAAPGVAHDLTFVEWATALPMEEYVAAMDQEYPPTRESRRQLRRENRHHDRKARGAAQARVARREREALRFSLSHNVSVRAARIELRQVADIGGYPEVCVLRRAA